MHKKCILLAYNLSIFTLFESNYVSLCPKSLPVVAVESKNVGMHLLYIYYYGPPERQMTLV